MKVLLAALVPLFLFSCAHTAPVSSSPSLPGLPGTAVGAILPIVLDTSHSISGTDGCVLSFRNTVSNAYYEAEFPPGAELLFIALPPGSYEYKELYCGKVTWDLTRHHWARFQVQANKLSFLEGLDFYLTDARSLSASESNRKKSRGSALKLFGKLSSENRPRVISGYTGTAISPSALEKPAKWKGWKLVDAAGKEVAKTEREWPSFHSCYRGEEDGNPLWLGNLTLAATYEKGTLIGSKVGESWHTFSDHFLGCAQSVLKEFQPKLKSKLEYTIFL